MISDDLLIEAKKRAAEQRRTLRSLIEEGLRAALGYEPERPPADEVRIQWVTVEGGLPADLDLSSRAEMSEWILRERAGG